MKKIGLCILSLTLLFAFIGHSDAQGVKVGGEADSATEITISGEIDMCMAYRDSGITSILDMVPQIWGVGTPDYQKSDFATIPLVTLNFDVECADKVSGFLQLENQRLNGTAGTAGNVDFLGGDNVALAVEQAYIKVSEFLSEKLTFTVGIQDLKLTLREGEGAFFCDVAESESAAMSPIAEGFGQPTGYTFGAGIARDVLEFGGMTFLYGDMENDNYQFGFFWGTIGETGVAHMDEDIKGLHFDYSLPGDGNMMRVLLAQHKAGTGNIAGHNKQDASFYTFGVGAVYQAMPEQLEVYGEFYLQSGDSADVRVFPDEVKTMDQDANAFRFGGRYKLEHDLKPYFDLSYWYLSGDDGDPNEDNEDFVSYENVQSTLILEDNLLGLDLDSNYTAIKLEAGITTSLDVNSDGQAEEIALKLLYGMFDLNEEPDRVGITLVPPMPVNTPALVGIDDDLGTEIDITATLKYTDNLSFTLGMGIVSGADFFDSGADTNADGIPDVGYRMDDADMRLYMFDTRLKF